MKQADLELGLQAQQVLNSTIRPLLNIDAGDAEIASVQDGHVTISLLGACSRCCFRASCAVYTVLDRLDAELGSPEATFSVSGIRVDRSAALLGAAAAPAARS